MVVSMFTASSTGVWQGSQSWAQAGFDNLYPILIWTIGTVAAASILVFIVESLRSAFDRLEDWFEWRMELMGQKDNPLTRYRQTYDNDVPMLNLQRGKNSQITIDPETGQRSSARRIINLSTRRYRKIPVREG